MVVQHNLTAMNSNRMLGITTGQQAKSSEKLASGYQINRAADDAAGLSISEKMRKQIRGMDRASTNAQDGVSAVQTAEGALTEVHSMLQRMNELAVQAANGTNSEDDRAAIQAEIHQLTTEIDRVAETTKFNETYMLKGAGDTKQIYMVGHDAGLAGDLVDGVDTATFKMDGLVLGDKYTIGGKEYFISDVTDNIVDKIEAPDSGVASFTIDGTTYQVDEDGNVFAADGTTPINLDDNGKLTTEEENADGDAYDPAEVTDVQALVKDGSKVVINGKEMTAMIDEDGDGVDDYDDSIITIDTAIDYINKELVAANKIGVDGDSPTTVAVADPADTEATTWEFTITKGQAKVPKTLSFNLHVGADADMTNKIGVDVEPMTAAGLGIKGLNVSDSTGIAATYAIDAIADAVAKVSAQRSALGAIQNRLEHTIANLDNVVENTTAAESRIRDTDMAEEMVEYSKNNILAQAGQSMLAQANQATQGVLSLLQ